MRKPAFSFYDIQSLVYANNTVLASVITDELVIAICWEESMFNNTKQSGGGTGVGLGQVEPKELSKLKQYGVNLDAATILADPAQAIVAVSMMLYHAYQTGGRSRNEALRRYAGYYYDHANWRLKTIAGWEQCERKLLGIPDPKTGYPDAIMDALNFARPFKAYRTTFSAILFPDDE